MRAVPTLSKQPDAEATGSDHGSEPLQDMRGTGFLQRRPQGIKTAVCANLAVSAQHGDGENILETPGICVEQRRCLAGQRSGLSKSKSNKMRQS